MSTLVSPAEVQITKGRPVLVCDADEVLLEFIGGLERFLPQHGHYLDLKSYALTGNIRRQDDDQPVDQAAVSELLKLFYATDGVNLTAVAGAAAALDQLSRLAQIVILTNVTPGTAAGRQANLAALGMDYPVVTNAGPKGAALRRFAQRAEAPVAFIDDIASHHASVAEAWPETHQVHFIADARLFNMAKPSPHARLFSSSWEQTAAHLVDALGS